MTMPQIVAPKPLVILDSQTGEAVEISTGPLTVEEAASRLPFVSRTLRELRRFEAFLMDSIAASFTEGQTEKRLGDQLFELRGEAEWIVDDDGALFRLLHQATADGEITEFEFGQACAQLLSYRWHHGRLSTLAKRVPKIDEHRHRTEGPARLKVKK